MISWHEETYTPSPALSSGVAVAFVPQQLMNTGFPCHRCFRLVILSPTNICIYNVLVTIFPHLETVNEE